MKKQMKVYALSLFGFGAGDTLGEALRRMKDHSRMYIGEDFTHDDFDIARKGRRVKVGHKDLAALCDEGLVNIFMTDDPNPTLFQFGGVQVHDGYDLIFLGNQDYMRGCADGSHPPGECLPPRLRGLRTRRMGFPRQTRRRGGLDMPHKPPLTHRPRDSL